MNDDSRDRVIELLRSTVGENVLGLARLESKVDSRAASIEAKFDLVSARLDNRIAILERESEERRTIMRQIRNTVIVAMVGGLVSFVVMMIELRHYMQTIVAGVSKASGN